MPPIGRLTTEQAAVAFMLGESIQTSAGDPERAGEAIRVVGTNPFIIGSKGDEGNRFYDLLRENDVGAYLMNTGHLGDQRKSIGVDHSVTILTEVAERRLSGRQTVFSAWSCRCRSRAWTSASSTLRTTSRTARPHSRSCARIDARTSASLKISSRRFKKPPTDYRLYFIKTIVSSERHNLRSTQFRTNLRSAGRGR